MNTTAALGTERLLLRPCGPDDVAPLMLGLNDWSVARWMPGPPFPYTEADARAFIAATSSRVPPDAYVVADVATGEFCGILGLSPNGDLAELGYWLLPQHQGKGMMREAILCLFAALDNALSLIFATVDRGNAPSIRLLESVGLRPVGEHVRETPNRQGNTVVLRYEMRVAGRR